MVLNNPMKYKGNYFPFIIISLILYALFFYKNSGSVSTPINNNNNLAIAQDKAVSSATTAQQITQPTVEKESDITLLTKKIAARQAKLETEKELKTRQARIKAKQLHRQNIKQNEVDSDALLKEHIFNLQLLVFQQKVIEERQEKRKEQARLQKIAKQLEALKTNSTDSTDSTDDSSSIASMLPLSSSENQTEVSSGAEAVKLKITPKVSIKKTNSSTASTPSPLPKTSLTPSTTTPSKQSTAPKIKRIFKPKPSSEIPSPDTPTVIAPDEIPSSDTPTVITPDEIPSSDAPTAITPDEIPSSDAPTVITPDEIPSSDASTVITSDEIPSSDAPTFITPDEIAPAITTGT